MTFARSIMLAVCGVLLLSADLAATHRYMGVDSAVIQADLIVRGRVVERRPKASDGFEYGTVEVTETIYGDPRIRKVSLVLSYTGDGLSYAVGDDGVLFLRQKPLGGPQQLTAGLPGRSLVEMAQMGILPFTADHPDTCWAENDSFYERNKNKASKPSAKQKIERELQMLNAVRERLRTETSALKAALERTTENLKRNEAALRSATQPVAPRPASGDAGADAVAMFYQLLLQEERPTLQQEQALFAKSTSVRGHLVDSGKRATDPVLLDYFREHKQWFVPSDMKNVGKVPISSTYYIARWGAMVRDDRPTRGEVTVLLADTDKVTRRLTRMRTVRFEVGNGKIYADSIYFNGDMGRSILDEWPEPKDPVSEKEDTVGMKQRK